MGKRFKTTVAIVSQGVTIPSASVGQYETGDMTQSGQISDGYKQGQSTGGDPGVAILCFILSGRSDSPCNLAVPIAIDQLQNFVADVPVNTALSVIAG